MLPEENLRRLNEPVFQKYTDKLTEILIYFCVIFSPWAFGTTESWSIWTMNIAAYTLGLILIVKCIFNFATKFKYTLGSGAIRLKIINILNILLTFSIFILFIYILISAINARASFNPITKEYIYYDSYLINLNFMSHMV